MGMRRGYTCLDDAASSFRSLPQRQLLRRHSMSALLDASSLLPLRATSPMKAALITMRQRMIAPTITTGFFIQGGIMA
jgi:hypothetical protein